MKNNLFSILRYSTIAILLIKISGLFIDFSEKNQTIINSLMYIAIGFNYLLFGIALPELKFKITLLISGTFLIWMNFLPNNNVLSIIGIACIIMPMIFAKYSKETNLTENN